MHRLGGLHSKGIGRIHQPNGSVKRSLFKNGSVRRKAGTINFNSPMLPSAYKNGKSYTYLFAHPEIGMPHGDVMKRMSRKMKYY